MCSLEKGKIVILLNGRYAGHKAVIVRANESGTKDRPYPHLVVAGVDRAPLKARRKKLCVFVCLEEKTFLFCLRSLKSLLQVVRGMSKRTIAKRTRVKPFVKVVNMQHVMPTRFTMDIDLRGVVNASSLEPARRRHTKRAVRTQFEARHRSGQSAWFFSKLRF